jgi:hypothetical protein
MEVVGHCRDHSIPQGGDNGKATGVFAVLKAIWFSRKVIVGLNYGS